MLISDVDAEQLIESEAKVQRIRLQREIDAAKKRGVKNPESSQNARIERAKYQTLIMCIRMVRWERQCREAGERVVVEPVWEHDVKAELEAKWDEEYKHDQMRRKKG